MQLIPLLFWLVQIVFVPWFIRSGWPKTKRSSLFIKMVCSSAFVLFGVYTIHCAGRSSYGTQILIGLICGWFGDLFLTMGPFLPQGNKSVDTAITIVGGSAFLAGHIFYILAFFSVSDRKIALFLILYIVTLSLVLVTRRLLHLEMDNLTIPVIIYAMMVTFMFTSGVVAGVSSGSVFGILTLSVSTFLFLLSDLTLGVKTFAPKFNTLPVRILYLSAYYIAQMLLVHSIALVG